MPSVIIDPRAVNEPRAPNGSSAFVGEKLAEGLIRRATLNKYRTAMVIMAICFASCSPNQEQMATDPPSKILFVGNSFTFIHDGVQNHVKELAASAMPPRLIQADSNTEGGATLQIHYGRSVVHEAIREGAYDVVILQGDIPELTEHSVKPFFEHARLFEIEIRDAGAKTMFFMTWPYDRLNWISLEDIAAAHRDISTELNASVAPVGIAFERARAERPDLDMLVGDKEHESIHGMYLAASVLYASLFGDDPQGLPYTPTGVSAEEAAFLQRMAWETVQEWHSQR